MSQDFIAYRVHPGGPYALISAPRERDWMSASPEKFANRCLPLLMANQAGWWITITADLCAFWDGMTHRDGLTTAWSESGLGSWTKSHFGDGILTFSLPWLFRTPPGWDLLARGPANVTKDGIQPLEGLVETGWANATFTINWKCTRPGPVRFVAGEPIAQLVPLPRALLEEFAPKERPLSTADKETQEGYAAWAEGRAQFLTDLSEPSSAAWKEGWQKEYMRGEGVAGHRTRLDLPPFTRETAS